MRFSLAVFSLFLSAQAWAGSLMAVAMEEPVNIYVDDQALRTDPKGKAALLSGLSQGDHHVKVVSVVGAEILWEGTVNLADATSYQTKWTREDGFRVLKSKGWDGVAIPKKAEGWVTMAMKVADAALSGTSMVSLLGGDDAAQAISAPSGVSAEKGSAVNGVTVLRLSVTDGSMVNLWVDGSERLAVRQNGDYTVQVSSGAHQVELKDFPNLKVLSHGTLQATAGGVVRFAGGEGSGLLVQEGGNAWKPE